MSSSPIPAIPAVTASTPTAAPSRPGLLGLLAGIEDFRDPRGRRHPLATVLALGLAAVVTGARSFVAIAEWARAADDQDLAALGLSPSDVPEVTRFRRVFAGVDGDCLDQVLGGWLWTRTYHDPTGRKVIAIDGKTVRGARTPDRAAQHLLAAVDHEAGTVVGPLSSGGPRDRTYTSRIGSEWGRVRSLPAKGWASLVRTSNGLQLR